MTKEAYFEMCEALGTEPIDSEIPVDYSDFPAFVQESLGFYYLLRDVWDPMGGNYLGKDMSMLFEIFKLYDLENAEKLLHISIVQQIDSIRSKIIQNKKAQKSTEKPSQQLP